MELQDLITALSQPAAYPHDGDRVEVIQTHCSVVFLTARDVYKIKKPKDYGFLDYSTLERRLRFCRAEVDLNRRLAPDVYLGVVPIGWENEQLRVDTVSTPVEYAVHMRRLDEADTLQAKVEAGSLRPDELEAVAQRIGLFHREGTPNPSAARWSRFECVRENFEDNFHALAPHADKFVSATLFASVRQSAHASLERARELIERRAHEGHACDGHGDLRTDHVYVRGDSGGLEVRIVDCIEFDDRYRCGDPVADIAFLVMDLRSRQAFAAADDLVQRYLAATGDHQGAPLLPFYSGYRSMVRAKVECIRSTLGEINASDHEAATQATVRHLLLALGEFSEPANRPALILISGLPASGKSSLAEQLSGQFNLRWLRADVIRKELLGLDPQARASSDVDAGIYSPQHSDRTYQACHDQAREHLLAGGRVVVDATFVTADRRGPFVDLARELGVRSLTVVCETDESTSQTRLRKREGGPSDANVDVYRALRARWEPPRGHAHIAVDTSGSIDASVRQAAAALERLGL